MMNKREQLKEERRKIREARQERKNDHLNNYILKSHLNNFLTPKNIALIGEPDKSEIGEGKWADTIFYLYNIDRIAEQIIEEKIPMRINHKFMEFFGDRPYAFFNIVNQLGEQMRGDGFEDVLKDILIRKKYSSHNEYICALQCYKWWVQWFDDKAIKKIFNYASAYSQPLVREVANDLIALYLKRRHQTVLNDNPNLEGAL